jgi:hypothetical protein
MNICNRIVSLSNQYNRQLNTEVLDEEAIINDAISQELKYIFMIVTSYKIGL